MPRSASIPATAAIAVPATPTRWACCTVFGIAARRAAEVDSAANADRLHNHVVNLWAKLPDLFVVAFGMHAIGQQRHGNFLFRIDPDGSAGEAEMADRVLTEVMTSARIFRGGRVPSQS